MKAFQVKRLGFVVPALTVLLTAPFLGEMSLAESSVATEFAPLTRVAVRPGSEVPVTVKALPNATCILHPKGVTDAEHSMNLFSDSEGTIRFHANARQESTAVTEMQLDCTSAEGKFKNYPLALSASNAAALARPDLSRPEAEVLPKGATVREGLTEAEAASMSADELGMRKFPPRPDAVKSPKAYATWLRIVTERVTMMPAGAVVRPDISHKYVPAKGVDGAQPLAKVKAANGSSSNWSGYELRGGNRTYDVVEGEWYVPSVTSPLGVHSYSAYWVGLDGDGISDLVQAGTEQEYFNFSFFSFSNYYAWSELLPNQPTESEITGVPVGPGNEVFSEVWIGNSNGALNASGGYGLFYVHNLSTGQATEFETCLCGTVFLGREAEWIMERPTVNGSLPNLADYSLTTMWSAYAETVAGPWTTYAPGTANNINITMFNEYNGYGDDDQLSQVYAWGSTEMLFLWNNYH